MRRMLRACDEEGRTGEMTLRILDQNEHGRTRCLWEEVFTEDTKTFLDYYYYIKTRDNQIYVVEEDGQICSMLQLNPYMVRMEDKEFPSAYIIAVATKEQYRRRGYMGALLRASLNDMYAKKIPFTFLMPAAEAIYKPYDFRYVYSQHIGQLVCEEGSFLWKCSKDEEEAGTRGRIAQSSTGKITFCDAGLWDADEMSAFFNEHFAERYQVCTVRDGAYYQTMIMEQQSEGGGVRLMRKDGVLKGFYAYAAEEGLEVREPVFLPGYENEFRTSVGEMEESVKGSGQNIEKSGEKISTDAGQGRDSVKVHACPPEYAFEEKPLIMARIVCLPEFLSALKVEEQLTVDCSFAVIDPIITQNSRIWRVTSGEGETELHVRETEDSEGVLPMAELTEILFGRRTIEEAKAQEGVIIPGHLGGELEKITKLKRIFFNEVV